MLAATATTGEQPRSRDDQRATSSPLAFLDGSQSLLSAGVQIGSFPHRCDRARVQMKYRPTAHPTLVRIITRIVQR